MPDAAKSKLKQYSPIIAAITGLITAVTVHFVPIIPAGGVESTVEVLVGALTGYLFRG